MPNAAVLAALLATASDLSPDGALTSVRVVTLDAQQITEQSFGPEVQYKTVSALNFEPDDHDDGQEYRRFASGYRGVSAVPAVPRMFSAPLELPNGAEMDAICFQLYDDSAAYDMRIGVMITEADFSPNDSVPIQTDVSYDSGYFTECFEFPSGWTFRTWANWDQDLYGGYLYWELRVRLTAAIEDQRFRGAYVKYHLRLSPAPAVATFDDVATGDAIYPYVEALNAAGVSVGCGPDRFCPNDPVTRGQLAVFMARALGLHWPF